MAVEDLQKLIDQSNAVMQAVRAAQAEQSKTVPK
jgi:hypothetical protein